MSFLNRHKIIAGILFLIVVWLVMLFTASPRGYLAARIDLARGHYEQRTYGLPAPWRKDYAALLQQRYGIQLRTVAGCIVTDSLTSFCRAYSDTQREAITQRFGRDVMRECSEEARSAWKQKAEQNTEQKQSNHDA